MSQQLLILDLDETLILAVEQPLRRREDFLVGPYYVYRRPYLQEFLAEASRHFRLAVWTSSTRGYADLVVENVFGEDHDLAFVWDRDRCAIVPDPETASRHWVKDLKKVSRLGYPLDRIIVLDDTPQKLARHRTNLIPVRAWDGDIADEELKFVMQYLPKLLFAVNIRRRKLSDWREHLDEVT